MKLVLTGSTGFIGRNILLRVLNDKVYDQIILPVRDPDKLIRHLSIDGYRKLPCSINILEERSPLWNFGILNDVDHMIHCAGVISTKSQQDYFATNVDATLSLFERLRFKKAVVLSSQAASGPSDLDGRNKSEWDLDSPLTWYGKSKLEMERRVLERFPNREYIFIRAPMVLGPRDQASLPLFKMVRGPVSFKPGLKLKHYSYIGVGDLVSSIFSALNATFPLTDLKQRHFYVTGEGIISDLGLIQSVAKASNQKGFIIKIPQSIVKILAPMIVRIPSWGRALPSLSADRRKEIWPDRWMVSSKAFEDIFRWKPKDMLHEVIRDSHDWYYRHGLLK